MYENKYRTKICDFTVASMIIRSPIAKCSIGLLCTPELLLPVSLLNALGFAADASQAALSATRNAGVQPAMDW